MISLPEVRISRSVLPMRRMFFAQRVRRGVNSLRSYFWVFLVQNSTHSKRDHDRHHLVPHLLSWDVMRELRSYTSNPGNMCYCCRWCRLYVPHPATRATYTIQDREQTYLLCLADANHDVGVDEIDRIDHIDHLSVRGVELLNSYVRYLMPGVLQQRESLTGSSAQRCTCRTYHDLDIDHP